MRATETDAPTVAIDRDEEYRIECYVRATVPGPTRKRITSVTDRLRRLDANDVIADYRIRQWPPERYVAAASEGAPPRRELVSAFEQWARQHDCSLEPAFRRREVPSWPLGHESAETCERVRVPVVALALYDDADAARSGSEQKPKPDLESLEGVVPYTEQSSAERDRTYTVDEWLSAVESEWCDAAHAPESEQRSLLGGQP